MISYVIRIVTIGGELTTDERELLSVAFKNAIGPRRASWRTISSIEQNKAFTGSEEHIPIVKSYRSKVEGELEKLCKQLLNILDNSLLPNVTSSESNVFYHNMKGDHNRYLAEIASGEKRDAAATAAQEAYIYATTIAQTELSPTVPIRLGLALNFSVFQHEILNSPEYAFQIAKQALDDATAELKSKSEGSYRETRIVLQLLQDNLNLWTDNGGFKDASLAKEIKEDSSAEEAEN